jgi:hypothetical protein
MSAISSFRGDIGRELIIRLMMACAASSTPRLVVCAPVHALQQEAHSRSQPIVCGALLIDVTAT